MMGTVQILGGQSKSGEPDLTTPIMGIGRVPISWLPRNSTSAACTVSCRTAHARLHRDPAGRWRCRTHDPPLSILFPFGAVSRTDVDRQRWGSLAPISGTIFCIGSFTPAFYGCAASPGRPEKGRTEPSPQLPFFQNWIGACPLDFHFLLCKNRCSCGFYQNIHKKAARFSTIGRLKFRCNAWQIAFIQYIISVRKTIFHCEGSDVLDRFSSKEG